MTSRTTGVVLAVRHDFRLLDPASWLSYIIRKLDKCWANHAAIMIWIDGNPFVMEARSSGVVLSTYEQWLEHRPYKKFMVGLPSEHPADISNRILSRIGSKYDVIGLLFWHPMRLLFGKWFGGRSDKGKWVCSEIVGWCYREIFPEWRYLTTGMIMKSDKFTWLPPI